MLRPPSPVRHWWRPSPLLRCGSGVAPHGDAPDIGLAVGIALTPPHFFRPIGR